MAAEIPSTTDLFEIIRTTPSMRRLKADPVPNELIEREAEAALGLPPNVYSYALLRSATRWDGSGQSAAFL